MYFFSTPVEKTVQNTASLTSALIRQALSAIQISLLFPVR